MIARMWHGAVPRDKGDDYLRFLQRVALPDYRATPGNRGVRLLRREEGDACHFVLISLWESRESIRAFAGDDVELARYYPEDAGFLRELEPRVAHYEVLASPAEVID